MPETTQSHLEALRASVTPILASDMMAEAARKAVLKDLLQMLQREEGSRSGTNAEDVHKMRVATRRMRSTFLLFGHYFKAKSIAPFLRELRNLGRALGQVRDLDVMIDNLSRFQATLNEQEQEAMIPALAVLDERRAAARNRLASVLDKKAYRQFVQELSAFVTTPEAGTRPHSKDDAYPPEVRYQLPIEVYRHLATIRAYDSVIADADQATLHSLRIEFKHLRYLIAIFDELLDKRGKAFIEELKVVQDHLGALNDAVVARDELPELLSGFAGGHADALQRYLDQLATDEAALRADFPRIWKRFNSPAVQRRLAGAIASL